MASACLNNIGMSPENFLDCTATTFPSYGWLSPRISFSREFPDEESKIAGIKPATPAPAEKKPADQQQMADLEVLNKDVGDFEFRLEDPVMMLPADELFSDGKLMPLQVPASKPTVGSTALFTESRSPETEKGRRRTNVPSTDPYLFSPKAPRCSSRWKDFLGLKKLYQTSSKQDSSKLTSSLSSHNPCNAKSLKHLLHRSSKSSSSSSSTSDSCQLSLPLLKDSSDCESVSLSSSRLSLSSSSSGHEHDDLPRLSLDSDKPCASQFFRALPNPNPPRVRVVKPRASGPSIDHQTATRAGRGRTRVPPEASASGGSRGVSVDSPRMNSSGKIVFHSLERSSSSPSSLNGGPRFKHRGMERSYSANVRVTPVLNVPVCSLRGSSKSGGVFGFGQLFASPQKRDYGNSSTGGCSRNQQSNSRNRSDRT